VITLFKLDRASVGFIVGAVLIVVGLYLLTGIPAALIASGVAVLVGSVLLVDVDAPPPGVDEELAP
jgi:membrane-bound ClpP family serine protease